MTSVGLFSGPTGGHIIPACLVAGELSERGGSPTLYSARSSITKFLPDVDFPLVDVAVSPWSGQSVIGRVKSLLSMGREFLKLRSRIANHDLLVSFGGYPAVPGLLEAWLQGTTTYFQEQNRVPGRTHRLFDGMQTQTFFGFPPEIPSDDPTVAVTGNPVRPPGARNDSWLDREPLLVVVGGSQGSREISQYLKAAAERFLESGWSLYYITGKFGLDLTAESWSDTDSFRQTDYDVDLHEVLPRASCVWSRGGAGTLSELIAYQVPAIVFPFGHATDAHQLKNALWVGERGPVDVVREDDPSAEELVNRTTSLRGTDKTYSVPWDQSVLPQVTIARRILS